MSQLAYVRVAQRDLRLASVRYRGLLPACALQNLGWNVIIGEGVEPLPERSQLAISVKPLTERDARWVASMNGAGAHVVVDLCDNVFIDGYGGQGDVIGRRFVKTAASAAAVTVPTNMLRDVVLSVTGLPESKVLVVPDIVESPALLRRQRKLLDQHVGFSPLRWSRWLASRWGPSGPKLFWYGNHGASYASFGMDDLLLFRDALEQAAARVGAELWIVSNHRERFDRLAKQLPIRCRYFEWTPSKVDELLPVVDVCLVPNSLDPFSATKSANRALKALNAGVPVVATPVGSYAGLESAMWLSDPSEGVLAYLTDAALRKAHLREAGAVIARDHSMATLEESLSRVIRLVHHVDGAV